MNQKRSIANQTSPHKGEHECEVDMACLCVYAVNGGKEKPRLDDGGDGLELNKLSRSTAATVALLMCRKLIRFQSILNLPERQRRSDNCALSRWFIHPSIFHLHAPISRFAFRFECNWKIHQMMIMIHQLWSSGCMSSTEEERDEKKSFSSPTFNCRCHKCSKSDIRQSLRFHER